MSQFEAAKAKVKLAATSWFSTFQRYWAKLSGQSRWVRGWGELATGCLWTSRLEICAQIWTCCRSPLRFRFGCLGKAFYFGNKRKEFGSSKYFCSFLTDGDLWAFGLSPWPEGLGDALRVCETCLLGWRIQVIGIDCRYVLYGVCSDGVFDWRLVTSRLVDVAIGESQHVNRCIEWYNLRFHTGEWIFCMTSRSILFRNNVPTFCKIDLWLQITQSDWNCNAEQ